MLSVDEQMRIITSGAAQIVPEADLRKKLEKGEPLNIKLGVDPTSPDLHLGHAVPLRKMRQFQDLGHNVTLIIGNGTALIGDPSGKNSTRPQLSQEQIEANAETYVSQAMKILDPEKTTIVHNGDWILSMDLAGLLQVCSKFTVARILERFLLELGHSRSLAELRVAVEYPCKLRVRGHLALDEYHVLLGVKADGEQYRIHLEGLLAELRRLGMDGQSVEVGDGIKAVVILAHQLPIPECAEVVAEGGYRGGLDSAEHYRLAFGVFHCYLFSLAVIIQKTLLPVRAGGRP